MHLPIGCPVFGARTFMGLLAVLLLAIIQGAAELLPVSSSAHVIVAGQLLGYDVGSPAFIFVLVMLHTGTMGAVIIYFYSRWKTLLTGAPEKRNQFIAHVALASCITAAVALVIIKGIEKTVLGGGPDAHFETLGRNPKVVAAALFAAKHLDSGLHCARTPHCPENPADLFRIVHHWLHAGTVLALPRLLALRRHDFIGNDSRHAQAAR